MSLFAPVMGRAAICPNWMVWGTWEALSVWELAAVSGLANARACSTSTRGYSCS